MAKFSNDKLIKKIGGGLILFGAVNWFILLFHMYFYLYDHMLPSHPQLLEAVAAVAVVSTGIGCIMFSVENWYSRKRHY